MADAIKVLGISGSLRHGSYNSGLLRAATTVLPPDVEMTIFPLHNIPLFNSDVERAGNPEPVAAMQQAIGAAAGLLFAVPEYNYSISGVLKNAIDWASRGRPSTLDGKPVAIMGVGGRQGTARAQMHMRQIALHNSLRVMIDPELLLARSRSKFDPDGNLTDADTREQLREFMAAFDEWIRHCRVDPTLRFA
ncbi:MAG: NAD(P)H-dependent oxidoreductase [Chloroflexota bacterium]|nr:NAD(P)H-dependent oxidoreductase [Chloroflexota bacterium]MDE2898892.1 NAD(P)H-dependent oxidoreductase [Chloroflexota bacterium]